MDRLAADSSTKGELVVYADPPYSRAQYSRYYHLLETLILYDYPEISGKGRYRSDRFHTDFSRTSRVANEMGRFLRSVASTGATLYLSYPTNGLFHRAENDLLSLLQTTFNEAHLVRSISANHSTLGGSPGSAAVSVTEELYYARC